MYRSDLTLKCLKKIHYFFLFPKVSIIAVCIRPFNVNYSNTTPCLSHSNTFKARSQTPVNKHNPTCGMCYCVLRLIPIATDMVKTILLGSRYDEVLFTCSKFVGIIMLGNQ